MSMSLKLLFSLSSVLRGVGGAVKDASNFASILSSTSSSKVTSLVPTTDSFLIVFVQSNVIICIDVHTPKYEQDGGCHYSVIKSLQHLVADMEGSDPLQKEKKKVLLLMPSVMVLFTVQYNTQVLMWIHKVHISPNSVDRKRAGLFVFATLCARVGGFLHTT